MSPPAPAAPEPRFAGLRVFAVLALLYLVAFLPALRAAWWCREDYALAALDDHTRWEMALRSGRPLAGLLLDALPLDGRPDAGAANVVLRLGRALLHVAAAWLLVRLLWGKLGSWRVACLAALPFLLWYLDRKSVV